MIVAPGSRCSSRAAISAVSVDGLTISPRSSTTKHRSASPSKASPRSALLLQDCLLQIAQVLRVDRVRLVVGEAAVELEVELGDGERQALERGRDGEAAHAVAGVDDDRERAHPREVRHQLLHVRRVVREHVLLGDRAGALALRDALVEEALGFLADLDQAALLADRLGAGEAELDPVVLRRVVAGREHRPGDVHRPGGVVEQVGRAETGVDDVDALAGRAVREGGSERDAGLAHVAGGDDLRRHR